MRPLLASTAWIALVLLAACASKARTTAALGVRPKPMTVQRLSERVQQGESIGVLFGEIDATGTVYRLRPDQRESLRADGMPVALLGRMQDTYDAAVKAHPELGASNDKWIEVDGYWYGGLPAGWPREWVVPGAR